MTDTTASDRQRVADLVSRAKVAMLTTVTQESRHVSRPMGLADTAEYWEGPTSTVARVAGNLRAAVTGNPGKDPVRDDTAEL